ncbi:FAD dependent oxidoreductase family protein [Ralstonia insidiosa]|uniref:FAD dependent oxidoreductase family protein n=2 Tax=Burkholderiaceae TaxID=119060 RepID=A0AAC9BLX7_9RALS|nr:FAD dependent oxidoreductase family protein [Ralstonia insidiosa]
MQPIMTQPNLNQDLRVVVLGAGMSGILSGIKLLEAGYKNVTIYEKASRVGGTWRENTYPGLTCDVPSHAYTYSFEPNAEWTRQLPPGAEVQGYFEQTTRKYKIDELIRFNQEVKRCEFKGGRWHLETASGLRDTADVVIAATGVLHHPRTPNIPGLKDFTGDLLHSARWDHAVPLDGKRIGIIGNGSTGVQLVSALAGRAGKLKHFQRTAQWIMPVENPTFTEEQKQAFRDDPALLKRMQNDETYVANVERFTTAVADASSPEIAMIEAIVLDNLERSVPDPVLREKLRPNYRAACKRLIFSPDYYQAIQHPNAELVTDDIETVTANGVLTRDGTLHELDVLVTATGFHADRFMRPTQIVGRDGRRLDDVWAKRPHAYLAISVPEFPNFFMLNGPTSPVGNFSLIDVAEKQWGYIAQLLDLLRSGECSEIAATQEALDAYEASRLAAAKNTIFASGCNSWYLDGEGVPASWPWNYARFRDVMAAPDLSAFEQIVSGAEQAVAG